MIETFFLNRTKEKTNANSKWNWNKSIITNSKVNEQHFCAWGYLNWLWNLEQGRSRIQTTFARHSVLRWKLHKYIKLPFPVAFWEKSNKKTINQKMIISGTGSIPCFIIWLHIYIWILVVVKLDSIELRWKNSFPNEMAARERE